MDLEGLSMVPNRSLTRTMTMRSGYGNLHCNQENPVLLPSFGCYDIDPKENRANMSEDYFGFLLVRDNGSVEGVAISRTSKQFADDSYGPPRGVGELSSRVDNTSAQRIGWSLKLPLHEPIELLTLKFGVLLILKSATGKQCLREILKSCVHCFDGCIGCLLVVSG